MASLKYDPTNRTGIIQFTNRDEDRKTFRLSNVSKTTADRYLNHISHLNDARRTNSSVRGETVEFLNSLGKRDYKRLAKLELVEPRELDEDEKQPMTLGGWLDAFERMKSPDWKPASKVVFGHTRRNLLDCFAADKPLRDITILDAENFERFLKGEKLAKATSGKRCSIARAVFDAARKHRLIETNVFKDANISVVVRGNRSRQAFIKREEIDRVITACPDSEWRLLVGLARFGGLRIPSEALSLKWEHVDWERNELFIPSPKTEHHEGHESRLIPLFPELRALLQEAFEQAPDRAEWVIIRHRSKAKGDSVNWQGINLRTQFEKIIKRSGVKPWPRLWGNLRSTRATELLDDHPAHVVNQWLGHCERVANEHYRQTTQEHFDRAVKGNPKSKPCSALQPALHYGASSSITEQDSPKSRQSKHPENAAFPKKQAVSQRTAKPPRWTIQDSNL